MVILTQAEIADITERKHIDAQVRVLDEAGIPNKVVGRRILVSRVAYEAAMAKKSGPAPAANEEYTVDLEAMRRRREHGKKARAG